MKKQVFLFLLSSMLIADNAFAGSMGYEMVDDCAWVGTLSLGPALVKAPRSQSFFLAPNIEKAYVAKKSSKLLLDGELFLGYQMPIVRYLNSQLGLAVAGTTPATFSGDVWDDADPVFNNHNYSYKIQHTMVAIKGKLLADAEYGLIPWLSVSIGVGFNSAGSFHNTATIPEARVMPNFGSHNTITFSGTVGAGVQKCLNDHWQFGVGYEFANWGRSQLLRAPDQTMGQGLTHKNLFTNGLLFNLTYIA